MSNKKPQWSFIVVQDIKKTHIPMLLAFGGVADLDKLGKILDFSTSGCQYFGNTVRRRPTGLPFFGPTFAFIKGCWVQTTAFCQPRTRHSVFGRKAFNRTPYIIVGHFSLLRSRCQSRCGRGTDRFYSIYG